MKWLLFILLLVPEFANAQIVETIAGNGTAGYTGDNNAATSAQLYKPAVAKFDTSGNIYIADFKNNVIRKINSLGIITTIAGTGTPGYFGDNGPATDAKLSLPTDLAFDAYGNLYVTDGGNNVIRKITRSGYISTIAGNGLGGYSGDNGPATNARLYDPIGLAFDRNGNLLFSDNGNHLVRKIDTYGIISAFAGTGTSGFGGDGGPATAASVIYPGYLAISPLGEVYIADYENHRVRKIDTFGIITTVAGNGAALYSGDGGPATEASLVTPYAILFDNAGDYFITDWTDGHKIRKVNTHGIISTIAGNGTTGYCCDGEPATSAEFSEEAICSTMDRFGNLYIADFSNNRIRKITDVLIPTNANSKFNYTLNNASILPNPAHSSITINSPNKIETITITNILGQIVTTSDLSSAGEKEAILDISKLTAGIYHIRVNGLSAGKFVKE